MKARQVEDHSELPPGTIVATDGKGSVICFMKSDLSKFNQRRVIKKYVKPQIKDLKKLTGKTFKLDQTSDIFRLDVSAEDFALIRSKANTENIVKDKYGRKKND